MSEKKNPGAFTTERAKEAGRKSGEARRRKREERRAAQEEAEKIAAVMRIQERDRALAPTGSLNPRERLEHEALHSPNPASRVAALRALLDAESDAEPFRPPPLEALDSLTVEELEALVASAVESGELAPMPPMPAATPVDMGAGSSTP